MRSDVLTPKRGADRLRTAEQPVRRLLFLDHVGVQRE
jgi:hypothetical protein